VMLNALEYTILAGSQAEMVAKRAPLRAAHLALVERWRREGKLVMGGGLVTAPFGALIVLRGPTADAEAFARADPYVTGGLVSSWRVRQWAVVVAEDVATGAPAEAAAAASPAA
jgi:uncharacterized protein YciI